MHDGNGTKQAGFTPAAEFSAGSSSIRELLEEGERAYASDLIDEARQCFERVLQRDPLNTRALNNLSVLHWSAGRVEEGLRHLMRAMESDRDDPDVIMNCCSMFEVLGQKEAAVEILKAYVDRNSWDREAHHHLQQLENGDQTSVAAEHARLFTEQGEIQFDKGRLEHARACFEIALEHRPDFAQAHNNLGVWYWHQGDMEKALQNLHQALVEDTANPEILRNCSRCLAAVGENDSASELLKVYLKRYPQDDQAWTELERLLAHGDDHQWHPRGLDDRVAGIYFEMGKALATAEDFLGAAEAFHRALQIDARHIESCYQLAMLHLTAGQEAEALEFLTECLRLNPDHRDSVLATGRLLAARGKLSQARDLYHDYLADSRDEEVEAALSTLGGRDPVTGFGASQEFQPHA